MSRREAAERWKSAVEGEAKLRSRTSLGIAIIVLVSGLIGSIDLRYGIGAVLLLDLAKVGVNVQNHQTIAAWSGEHTHSPEFLRRLVQIVQAGFRCQIVLVRSAHRALAAGWLAVWQLNTSAIDGCSCPI